MRIGMGLAAVACVMVFGAYGYAQDSARAQQLKAQGIAAGDRKDWNGAIGLLSQAQKLAPGDPSIMYSLGAIHEKAGNSLQAIAWLRAYLQTAPSGSVASQVALEIAGLRNELRGEEDRIFNQAEHAAAQIDRSTPAGAAAFPLAMGDVAHDEVRAGRYDEADETAMKGRLAAEDAAYLKDHILTMRAHVAALEGDFDTAAGLLPQIKDLQFAVGGVAMVMGTIPTSRPYYPSKNAYNRDFGGNGETGFWSHIKREVTQTPCYRVDEALAKQVRPRIPYDQEPPAYHGWMGNDVSGRPEEQNTGSSCTRNTAAARWVSFAETICDRGSQCAVDSAVSKAASERDLFTTAFRLSGIGADVGKKLLDFEILDARTSRRPGN